MEAPLGPSGEDLGGPEQPELPPGYAEFLVERHPVVGAMEIADDPGLEAAEGHAVGLAPASDTSVFSTLADGRYNLNRVGAHRGHRSAAPALPSSRKDRDTHPGQRAR